jgi:hypothetical protein
MQVAGLAHWACLMLINARWEKLMEFQVLDLCGDTLVSSFQGRNGNGNASGGSRGIVRGFSARSRSGLVRYLRGAVADYKNFVTLTLPGEFCNADGKRHWRALVERIRRWTTAGYSKNAEWSMCWFMEFQKRGAMHFHAFTTFDIDKDWLAKAWFEVVGSGDERHRAAGTRVERLRAGKSACARYAAKYAAKHEQKVIPLGAEGFGRFWGIVGLRSHVAAQARVTAQALEFQSISFIWRRIRTLVRRAVAEKKASMKRCAFATVYWIKDFDTRATIDNLIRLLNLDCRRIGEGMVSSVFNEAEVW